MKSVLYEAGDSLRAISFALDPGAKHRRIFIRISDNCAIRVVL